MNCAATHDLIDQLRTGLIQPEELTEPEMADVLRLRSQEPTTVPVEVVTRLRLTQKLRGRVAEAR